MKKFNIMPGTICSFDPKNIINQSALGTITVEVLEIVSRGLFGNNTWKVRDVDDPNVVIQVPEKYLYPANMVIIRYPVDLPYVNNLDLEAIDKAISILTCHIPPKEDKTYDEYKSFLDRMKALKEKLDITYKMREV